MYNKSNLIVGFIFVHTFHGAVVEKLQRGYDFGKTLTLIRRVSGNLRNISECERVELIRVSPPDKNVTSHESCESCL